MVLQNQYLHNNFLRRISQSEIQNSTAAESEGGQKFLPPNPLPFCPPERSVWRAKRAVSSVQNRFGFRQTNAPIGNSTVFSMDTSGRRKAPTKDFLAGLQGNSEFLARKRASRLAKTRFEPKSFSAATFFTKRLLSCAILGKELASFIHSAIGSSQPVRFCSRRVDCSSSDFFSLNNFDFSNRYVSRSMSCFK